MPRHVHGSAREGGQARGLPVPARPRNGGAALPRRRRRAHRWRLFGDWRKEVERLRRLHSILFAADTALEHGDAAAALALVLRLLGFQALSRRGPRRHLLHRAHPRCGLRTARRHLTRPRPPTADDEDGDLGVFADLDGVMEKKGEGRGLEGSGGSSAAGDTARGGRWRRWGSSGGMVLAVAAPQ
jgi:hypothetical protein